MAKLAQIVLENFCGHASLTVPLAPLTIVTGPSGSGKSSILRALEWVLSGETEWKNSRVKATPDLAHNCASSSSVSIVSEKGGVITRTVQPHRLSCSWAPGAKTLDDAQRQLEKALQCSGSAARVAIRAGRFFSLEAEDRNALLFELLEAHATTAEVKAILEAEQMESLPLLAVATKCMGGEHALSNLGFCENSFVNRRRDVNASLKELKRRVAELDEEGREIVPVAAEDMPDVEKRLAVLWGELAELTDERGEIRLVQHDGGIRLGNLQRELTMLQKAKGEVLPTAEEVESEIAEREGVLADLRKDQLKAQVAYDKAKAKKDELYRELSQARSHLGRWQGKPLTAQVCEACGHESSDTQAHRREGEDLNNLCKTAEAKHEAIKLPKLIDNSNERNAQEKALYRARETAQAIKHREGWDALEGRLTAQVAEEEQALARAEEANAASATRRDAIESRQFEIRGEARQLEQQLADASQWQTYAERARGAKERLRTSEEEQACLSHLCQLFNEKTGIPARIVGQRIAGFIEECNALLTPRGLQVRYEQNEIYGSTNAGKSWVLFDGLSRGERLRVALGMQVVFARRTGIGIVVCDEIEGVETDVQRQLLDLFLELTQGPNPLDHILVMGINFVNTEAQDGVSVIRLSVPSAQAMEVVA